MAVNKEVLKSAREIIGCFLRELRKEKGIPIQRLRDAGMNFHVIKSIEEGSKSYTIDSLLIYCQVVGINPVFLPAEESDDPQVRIDALAQRMKKML